MIQSGKEWHEFRKNHITSTGSYTIWCGKDADLMRLWEEKMGIAEDIEVTEAMLHGKRMEPVARDFFNRYTGDFFLPDVRESAEVKWMGASLDGINLSNKAILEIKCPYTSNLLQKTKEGVIEDRYFFQMQHQMMTTGIHHAFFLVFEDEKNYCISEVEYDSNICGQLFEKEKAFWELVKSKTPPIPQREDDQWILLEKAYWELKEKETLIGAEVESILNELKTLAGERSAFGPTMMLSKYTRRGNIDYGKIPQLKDVDLEEYRKKSSVCWRASKR